MNTVERVARVIDPGAFDRQAFDARADYYTHAGDFERRQEKAIATAAAALKVIRDLPPELALVGVNWMPHIAEDVAFFQARWQDVIDAMLEGG